MKRLLLTTALAMALPYAASANVSIPIWNDAYTNVKQYIAAPGDDNSYEWAPGFEGSSGNGIIYGDGATYKYPDTAAGQAALIAVTQSEGLPEYEVTAYYINYNNLDDDSDGFNAAQYGSIKGEPINWAPGFECDPSIENDCNYGSVIVDNHDNTQPVYAGSHFANIKDLFKQAAVIEAEVNGFANVNADLGDNAPADIDSVSMSKIAFIGNDRLDDLSDNVKFNEAEANAAYTADGIHYQTTDTQHRLRLRAGEGYFTSEWSTTDLGDMDGLIAGLTKSAFKEGYEGNYENGYEQGYEVGFQDGYIDGFNSALEAKQ